MSGASSHTGLRALQPENEHVLLEALATGTRLAPAARLAGISERSVRQWLEIAAGKRDTWFDGSAVTPAARENIERFARAVGDALDRFEQEMVGSIRQAATTVNPKTGAPDWRAGLALLTHHPAYRENWHEHKEIQVTHSGTVNHALEEAAKLDDAALMAAYAQLQALPAGE